MNEIVSVTYNQFDKLKPISQNIYLDKKNRLLELIKYYRIIDLKGDL